MVHEHGQASDADEELATARKWLDALDLPHAAVHVAQAIAADPGLAEAYEELDRMRTAELFPVVGEGAYIGNGAARAYLDARDGRWANAFALIAVCLHSQPTKPWTAAPWWPRPGVKQPRLIAGALAKVAPVLRGIDNKAALRPFLELARTLIDTAPGDIELAVALSGVANALDAEAEAATWCTHAAEHTPGSLGWALLGYALRDADRPDEAFAAWVRAADGDPTNADVRIALAKALIDGNNLVEAGRWLDAAHAIDSGHTSARLLSHALTFRKTESVDALIAMVDEAEADADKHRHILSEILAAACSRRQWLHYVPMPTESVTSMIERVAAMRAEGKDVKVSRSAVTAIEPPSAVAVAQAYLPGARLQVLACPQPDLRIPLRKITHQAWVYANGTAPLPAHAPPSQTAVESLLTVADLTWTSPVDAYDRSAALGSLSLADLLGLLCHMPPHPDNDRWNKAIPNPAYWPRLAAAWVCLGILHQQPNEAWQTSTRRQVLVDLAFGIEDWAADSALFALVTAAWMDPAIRADVHAIVMDRFNAARTTQMRRVLTIVRSFAELVMITPGVDAREIRRAKNVIRRARKPVRNRLGYVIRRLSFALGH